MIGQLLCRLGLHRIHTSTGHGLAGIWHTCQRPGCTYFAWETGWTR
jgi:hypothetical protein